MKICWLLILLAVNAAFAKSAKKSTEIALQKLPKSVVLAAPIPAGKDQNTCQGFWFKNGYVCNLDKLKQFNKDDLNKLQGIKVDFMSLVERFQALHRSVKLIKSKLPRNIVKILTTDISVVSSQTDKCWNHMGKLRTNSLCTICSAQNYNYFFGYKAGMSMSTCREILDHCSVHIGHVVDLTELAIYLSKTVGSYARWHYEIQKSKNFFVQFLTQLGKTVERIYHSIGTMLWVKLFHLYESLKAKKIGKQQKCFGTVTLKTVSANLCESLVSLTHAPHLKKINDHLSGILKNLESELDLVTAYKQKKAAAKTSKSRSRSLMKKTSNWRYLKQKSNATSSSFSSDSGGSGVMVFESEDGSSSVAVDKQHPFLFIKLLNFSIVFP